MEKFQFLHTFLAVTLGCICGCKSSKIPDHFLNGVSVAADHLSICIRILVEKERKKEERRPLVGSLFDFDYFCTHIGYSKYKAGGETVRPD